MTPLLDRAVDASVLIVLADIGRLDLLTLRGRGAPPPPILAAYMAEIVLDAGEAATLALAMTRGLPAVLDDKAGRRAARALGIPHTGTIGVITEAKREGTVTSATALLRQAEQTGWFMPPDDLLTTALVVIGETWP